MTEQAEEWSDWTAHDNSGRPNGITDSTMVICEMAGDGDLIGPMEAREFDWCHDDAIAQYRYLRAAGVLDLIALARDARSPADRHREVCDEWEAAEGGRMR